MYKMILFLILSTTLWSYQNGDKVDADIAHSLHLDTDKVYVIDFFASWCISCQHELPLIQKLSQTLDQKKVKVLGIDVDEDIQKAKAFQKEMKLTFTVFDDPKGKIIKHFDPVGMPAIYLVKEGKVVSMILGAKDDIDKIIRQEIEKQTP